MRCRNCIYTLVLPSVQVPSIYDNLKHTQILKVSLRFFLWNQIQNDIYEGVYKFSGLAAWSENCKWYSSLPLVALCIAILWVSLVTFSAITRCVASQRVLIVAVVYFFIDSSGNFWIHPRIYFRVPKKAADILTKRMRTSFSRRTLLHEVSYKSKHLDTSPGVERLKF
jgi:hypothetical protein